MQNQQFFQELVENSPDLIAVLDFRGHYVYVNNAYERILGYKKEMFIGKHFSEANILTEESLQHTLEIFPKIITGKLTKSFRTETTTIHGVSVFFDIKYKLIQLPESNQSYVQIVTRDITEQTRLERMKEELLETNRLLSDVIDFAGVGVVITNPNQKDNPIIYINKGFTTITGYNADEALGRNCRFLQGPETNEEAVSEIREGLKREREVNIEILNYKKDNSTFWNELTLNAVTDEKGEVQHYVGIQQDITKRKILELELANDLKLSRNIQRLLLSNPLKSDCIEISGIYKPSHELGGDFFKWRQLNDDLYAVLIIDVMGHGIQASLLTMSLNASIVSILRRGFWQPSDVMSLLNHHMFEIFSNSTLLNPRNYFTGVYLLINTKEKSIQYINAGHPSFIIKHAEKVSLIESNALPIGIVQEPQLEAKTLTYHEDTEIFLYTDGLLEQLQLSTSDLSEQFIHEEIEKVMLDAKLENAYDDICSILIKLRNEENHVSHTN